MQRCSYFLHQRKWTRRRINQYFYNLHLNVFGVFGILRFLLQIPIPMTEGLDPVSMLTDGATVAQWNNEGLPSDKMSTQNAAILINCERWPLLIDPQLQGIKWIKSRYGADLRVISLGQKGWGNVTQWHVVPKSVTGAVGCDWPLSFSFCLLFASSKKWSEGLSTVWGTFALNLCFSHSIWPRDQNLELCTGRPPKLKGFGKAIIFPLKDILWYLVYQRKQ